MFSRNPPPPMCVDEKGGREFPSYPSNWSYNKKEGRKDEGKKKKGGGDGTGVKLCDAIAMSSKLM
jgi:hypothetical protein